jgi:outer membrane receptor protein involved in Fe transport
MRKNLILLSIILLFLFEFKSFAQITKNSGDGSISGKIVDTESNEPIEYIKVRLFAEGDTIPTNGVYTDIDGLFLLDNLAYGNYFAILSALGYNFSDTVRDITITKDIKIANLGTIKIEFNKTKEMQEVKVVGETKVIEMGLDKTTYNVAEDLSSRGGSANDVLNNLPGVELDQEGNITLRGNGAATVLIDGRPSSISGGNGRTLLDALPAGSIERIEIITNPSAKYNPEGTSGIINIVLKKNKLKGVNGQMSLNLGSGDLSGGNVADGSASLSYRNAFMNVYGTYSGRYLSGYRNNFSYQTRYYQDSSISIDQNRYGTDLDASSTFRIGADFYLKTRHLLAFSSTGNIGERNRTGDQWNLLTDENGVPVELWRRTSDDPTKNRNIDLNINYQYNLKEDRGSFSIDLNQSIGKSFIEGYYNQVYANPDSSELSQTLVKQQLVNREKNNISNAQINFNYLLPNINGSIETGVNTSYQTIGINTYSESAPYLGTFQEDTLSNFEYSYNEQVYAIFGVYNQKIKKLTLQGGLRFEQAFQIPNLISDTTKIVNGYFNVFPSGFLKYQLTENTQISLSFYKRLRRPDAEELNPFTSYADPLNLRRGNPFLNPQYVNGLEIGYLFDKNKFSFTTSVFYKKTNDVITRVREFYDDLTAAMTFANLNTNHDFGNSTIITFKPFSFWKNTFSFNINYIKYEDDNASENWNVDGFVWNVKYVGGFEFWNKTASIQINAAYNSSRFSVQGIAQRRAPIDISGEKLLLDGKLSVGFKVSDVFNRQGFYFKVDQSYVSQYSEFKWLTRRYYLTLSYKFGKLEISNKKKASGTGGGEDI